MTEKKDKVRIGLVGLGWIAQVYHLPILSAMQDVEIVAVCDSGKGRARGIADKYGVRHYYTDYQKMLKEIQLDAVDICTPTDSHKELAVAALEAGCDVFVEKPIARKYDEAVVIADAVKRTKRNLMVGMNNRFRPDAMFLRSFIESNEIGKVYYVKAGWLKKPLPEHAWLRTKSISGGGVFIDLGIVMLDLALWMTGYPQVSRVNAVNYSLKNSAVEDSSAVFLSMKNGATIMIEVSWSFMIENELHYCNIYGEQGSGKINPLRMHKEMHGGVVDVTPEKMDAPQRMLKRSFENELKHFIGAVRGHHAIISTSEEAVLRMKIVDAVYKSAARQKEIVFK
ncbi:MAG TPA: Gfo/Idh/MocA family oxidoreductase [Bacteroidota bacterium]|nr:Gfo/Idh/MocA family oxidoreductase [Bacteroidota bacterium]